MSMNVTDRLALLRELLRREKLSAFVFPSTDPHNGEYVPDHWKGREWVSGFNGSAGTVVVTENAAALWTDSRYFIAAAQQIEGTGIELMKLKIPGTPTIAQWLGQQLKGCPRPEVGIDGMVNSLASAEALITDLRSQGGITVRTNLDPLKTIWPDRPPVPQDPVNIHPLEFAGEDVKSKVTRIRRALRDHHADGMLMSALDDIAWTLNMRGTDVHCNPVFVSYLLISSTSVTLYINKVKVTPGVMAYLQDNGICVDDYGNVEKGLRGYPDYNILIDPNETCYTLAKVAACQEVVRHKSPVPALKAVKNEAEIRGYRSAMLKDGIAMVKFLKWLKPAVEAGGQTELTVDRKLTELRSQQPLFRDISFDTIAGYGTHAAIVHYEATPETDIPIEPHGMILIDSGAQYQDGTTDITRTIALGPVSDYEKHVYTLVLKGHIQLAMCKFPKGAAGTQMDILARSAMWREGLNYLHGTGHGVGHCLNVHEGPQSIRMEENPVTLKAGMVMSDEPAMYRTGEYGIRTENMILVRPDSQTEFGAFLAFDTLTLCYIDTSLIIVSMLSPREHAWLNKYHQHVYETLSPHLNAEEQAWLKEKTAEI